MKSGYQFKTMITSIPTSIVMTGLLASAASGQSKFGFFSLLCVLSVLFNIGAKAVAESVLPSSIGVRPSGCGSRSGECVGCGDFPVPGNISTSWGLPSGHAQAVAMAASYWIIYLYLSRRDIIAAKGGTSHNAIKATREFILGTCLMIVTAGVVMIQRVYARCHSVFQVVSGGIMGIAFGTGAYALSTLIFNDLPKM